MKQAFPAQSRAAEDDRLWEKCAAWMRIHADGRITYSGSRPRSKFGDRVVPLFGEDFVRSILRERDAIDSALPEDSKL